MGVVKGGPFGLGGGGGGLFKYLMREASPSKFMVGSNF